MPIEFGYTPSQISDLSAQNIRKHGPLTNYKSALPKLNQRNKFKIGPTMNNSNEGNNQYLLNNNEYNNIISMKKYGMNLKKVISNSRKHLIDQTKEIPLNIEKSRELYNPITGEIL